jgi:hypothetical protein
MNAKCFKFFKLHHIDFILKKIILFYVVYELSPLFTQLVSCITVHSQFVNSFHFYFFLLQR